MHFVESLTEEVNRVVSKFLSNKSDFGTDSLFDFTLGEDAIEDAPLFSVDSTSRVNHRSAKKDWWDFLEETKQLTKKEFITTQQQVLKGFVQDYGLYCFIQSPDSNYSTSLFHVAIERGNLHGLNFFIDEGIDVNFLDPNKYSGLQIALIFKQYECAFILLEAGASVAKEELEKLMNIDYLEHLLNKNHLSVNRLAILERIILLNININEALQGLDDFNRSRTRKELQTVQVDINKKIKANVMDNYITRYLGNQLKVLAKKFVQEKTLLIAENSIEFLIEGDTILLVENQIESVINYLEKQKDGLAYLTCGLLLQGYIQNTLPERLDNNTEIAAYMEKRTHNAIDYYLESLNYSQEYLPIIQQFLWELKIKGSASMQERLASFDIQPTSFRSYHAFKHAPVKLPRCSLFTLFNKKSLIREEKIAVETNHSLNASIMG